MPGASLLTLGQGGTCTKKGGYINLFSLLTVKLAVGLGALDPLLLGEARHAGGEARER